MGNYEPPNIPTELSFFSDCLVAISNQEYKTALETTKTGLESMLGSEVSISTQQLASLFYMTVGYLESRLREAYGESWEKHVEKSETLEKEKERCCSFCGKNQVEVKKIIAGPSVFICNECVGICNQILNESPTDSDERRT